MRYGIVGVFNERMHGKTTYAVKYVVSEVHKGTMYDEAYTNIHVGPKTKQENGKLIHYGDPKIHFVNWAEIEQLELPTHNGNPRAILLLDQLPNYLDARQSGSQRNVRVSKWMRESRQHGLDCIYTTWMPSEGDKRVVPFTDLMVFAYRREKQGFVYRRVAREAHRQLTPVRIDWPQARAVWKYFDSSELIKDPTIPGAIVR